MRDFSYLRATSADAARQAAALPGAMYPGDLATALVAFDAVVHLGERKLLVDDFFLLPGATADREHAIEPGEMITAIAIPGSAAARRSAYLKIRDRQSYEFAAASAAVGIEFEADGRTIRDLRVALGGVATKPWRVRAVEDALKGKALEPETVRAASLLAVEGAVDHGAATHRGRLFALFLVRAFHRGARRRGFRYGARLARRVGTGFRPALQPEARRKPMEGRHHHGRIVNNNLADYLVPTNADIPDIEVISVGIPDLHSSALGGKGVGELGIVGVAPAIANAVFHATGKRVRDLPITLEKLI